MFENVFLGNRNFSFKLLKTIFVFLRLIKDSKLCKDKLVILLSQL